MSRCGGGQRPSDSHLASVKGAGLDNRWETVYALLCVDAGPLKAGAAGETEAGALRAGATWLGCEPAAALAVRPPGCRLELCRAKQRLRPGG